jgi:hypothetical protein
VVPVEEWDHRVEAEAESAPLRPSAAKEWVTLVEAPEGGRGISLPEDVSSLVGTSLFIDLGGETCRVGVVVVGYDGKGITRTSVQLGTSHCGEPARGECQTGACGECRFRKVEGPQRGVTCQCPH